MNCCGFLRFFVSNELWDAISDFWNPDLLFGWEHTGFVSLSEFKLDFSYRMVIFDKSVGNNGILAFGRLYWFANFTGVKTRYCCFCIVMNDWRFPSILQYPLAMVTSPINYLQQAPTLLRIYMPILLENSHILESEHVLNFSLIRRNSHSAGDRLPSLQSNITQSKRLRELRRKTVCELTSS